MLKSVSSASKPAHSLPMCAIFFVRFIIFSSKNSIIFPSLCNVLSLLRVYCIKVEITICHVKMAEIDNWEKRNTFYFLIKINIKI